MTIATVLAGYAAVAGSLALLLVLLLARHVGRSPLPLAAIEPGAPGSARIGPELGRGQAGLLVFLSSSCAGCRANLPGLVELAATFEGGPSQILVAITGDRSKAVDLERALAASTTVLDEARARAVTEAYRVTMFPTFLRLDADGRIDASGHSILELTGGRRHA